MDALAILSVIALVAACTFTACKPAEHVTADSSTATQIHTSRFLVNDTVFTPWPMTLNVNYPQTSAVPNDSSVRSMASKLAPATAPSAATPQLIPVYVRHAEYTSQQADTAKSAAATIETTHPDNAGEKLARITNDYLGKPKIIVNKTPLYVLMGIIVLLMVAFLYLITRLSRKI